MKVAERKTYTIKERLKNQFKNNVSLDWHLIFLGLAILCIVNLNQLNNWTQAANYFLYDEYINILPVYPDEQILIVEIDEQSLSLLGNWPWPRSYHGQMIDLLTQANASVIAYNVVFFSENLSDQNDLFLAKSIKKSDRTILPLYFDRIFKGDDISEVLPASIFRKYASLGHVNSYLDVDGTLRSVRLMDNLSERQWPHFSFSTLLFNHPYLDIAEQVEGESYIPFVNRGDYRRVSFVDVLTGLVPLESIAQHTVFVGMTATSMGDPLLTPVNDKGRQSPAVDINANIYQALKHQSLIHILPAALAGIINSAFIFLVLYLIPRLSSVQQFVVIFLCLVGVWFLTYVLLIIGYWYKSAGLIIALLAVPFTWNLLRLSRLFHYLRQQLKLLKLQQSSETFHLPEYIQLNDDVDLINILSLMQIDDYRILNHSYVGDASILSIEKTLQVRIAQQEKILVICFEKFSDLERRKLSLLNKLFGLDALLPKESANHVRSDVFSQQLSLIEIYQQHMEMNHSLFEASIEGIAAGILVVDLSGKVLFQNGALKEFSNKPIVELEDFFSTISLLKGGWLAVLREAILLQKSVRIEAKSESKDLSVSVRCLDGQENIAPLLVFNITDISLIKQAHRSRNEMIDFLSHDLRSPMASLQALVHQVRGAPIEGSASVLEIINKVDQYSQRGLDFAEQFLSLAKVEAEEEVKLYEVDLYSVSQNALDGLYHQAQDKDIKLSLASPDDCWVMANGDLLERILLNLVSNAIKYSPNNSKVDISIQSRELNKSVKALEVRITDEGPGIPKELLGSLFKPFQRGSDSNTQKAQGIGLGLRFVDVALKRLGSQIEFESSADGTSFYFLLKSIDL
jgi:signal transduction histidine kinase/CHASE2 domain-containing sensor protein